MDKTNVYDVVKFTLSVFKGKQKARILWFLSFNPLRFSELKKCLDPVSKKVLSDQLKDLEKVGLIRKTIYPEVPVKVVYENTDLAESIRPLFKEIARWQKNYREQYGYLIKDDRLLIEDFSGDLILDIIGDKWKPELLRVLDHQTLRFGQIKKQLPHISQKVLTEHLREMEQHGLVERVVYDENPPRVEYTLTEIGYSLEPIFRKLYDWGIYYLSEKEKHPHLD